MSSAALLATALFAFFVAILLTAIGTARRHRGRSAPGAVQANADPGEGPEKVPPGAP